MSISRLKLSLALVVCLALGIILNIATHSPSKDFTGLWSGSSTIPYKNAAVDAKIELIVDKTSAKILATLTPIDPNDSVNSNYQITMRADILAIKAQSAQLSISSLHYSDKEGLEELIGRQIPQQGYLMSSQVWPITEQTLFFYATLGFGEEFGVFLNKL